MGVPSLVSFIKSYYPLSVETVYSSSLLPQYDNLFIDLNTVIHYAIRSCNTALSEERFEKIASLIITEIDKIVMYINPQRLLFLSVDGTVPRCKATEQRKRRFTADPETDHSSVVYALDKNMISPGTAFMETLNSMLKYYIATRLSSDPAWKKLKIIYSSHRSPGEGEQKVMDYLRESIREGTFNKNHRNLIFGNDADFILLTLLLEYTNIDIMYHETFFQSDVEIHNHVSLIVFCSIANASHPYFSSKRLLENRFHCRYTLDRQVRLSTDHRWICFLNDSLWK